MIQKRIPSQRNPLGSSSGNTEGALWPRGTQVLKLPEQSHVERRCPKHTAVPPRSSASRRWEVFRQFLEKKTRLFSFTGGYCREFYVVVFFFPPPKARFIRKKKGICSTLGILRCCSWALGPPAWSACPVRIQGRES